MSISASEASRLTGKSKQAVINAIKLGKISAVKDVDGAWQIEPVELFRHYQAASSLNGNGHLDQDTQLDDTRHPLDTPLTPPATPSGLPLAMLERIIQDKDNVIDDLRHQLAVATEEKQQLLAVVTALTNQVTPPKAKANWWQRLLGGA